jgi:hypothetical protein
VQQFAVAATVAAMLISPRRAGPDHTEFSHTDQPGGARQRQPSFSRESGAIRRALQGADLSGGPACQRPKAVEQLRLGGIDFTVTGTGTYATHIPTLNLTAFPSSGDVSAGLEALRRLEMDASAIAGTGKRLWLSLHVRADSIDDDQGSLNTPMTPKEKVAQLPNEMMRWQLGAMG